MSKVGRLQIAREDILKAFESDSRRVFWAEDIAQILEINREFWRLSKGTSLGRFIQFLMTKGELRVVELVPVNYEVRKISRYIWKEASPFEIAL